MRQGNFVRVKGIDILAINELTRLGSDIPDSMIAMFVPFGQV